MRDELHPSDQGKTQQVRLVDVFLLGPFMVFASTLIPKSHQGARLLLGLSGVLTVAYNWKNYRRIKALPLGSPKGCPTATRNPRVNTRNRDLTIKFFDYGPPNPSLPNLPFWRKLAKRWFESPSSENVAQAKTMRCGNCAVFDVSPAMRKCLPPVFTEDDYDRAPAGKGAVIGYCWAHKFKCASSRTCATWVHGGPITANSRSPLCKR